MTCDVLGLLNEDIKFEDINPEMQETIHIRNNWVLCYMPIILSGIQLVFLTFYFTYDTPVYYKNFNQIENMKGSLR